MSDQARLKRGTQIIYVPTHADGDPEHRDAESGFVTSVVPGYAFCRYWNKRHPTELRTKSCSERTPVYTLVIQDTRPQSDVDTALRKWC